MEMRSVLIVAVIILLGVREGEAATRTWEQDFQSGMKTITLSGSSNYQTVLVSFPTWKTNAYYQSALSLIGLNQLLQTQSSKGIYYIKATIYNKAMSYMSVRIQSSLGSQFTRLVNLRYLTIESTFPYMTTINLNSTLNQNYSTTPIVHYKDQSLSSYRAQIIHMISGFNVTIPNVNISSKISLATNVTIMPYNVSSPTMKLKVEIWSNLNLTFNLGSINIYVLDYQINEMMANQEALGFQRGSIPLTSSYTTLNLPITVTQNLTFYGFGDITNNNSLYSSLEFYLSIDNFNSDITFSTTSGAPSHINLNYISFIAEVNCNVSRFWNSITKSCQSCPNGTYLDQNQSCSNCDTLYPGCTLCNNSSCLSCNNITRLNGTICSPCADKWPNCITCNTQTCSSCVDDTYIIDNSSCVTCSAVISNCQHCGDTGCITCVNTSFILLNYQCSTCGSQYNNCSQCNQSACISCNTPYIIDSTQTCFLCEARFPNCSVCDNSTCLNCTGTQIFNGSHCFLCEARFPNCSVCDNSTCLNCTGTQIFDGSHCFFCEDRWPNCFHCDASVCLNCSGSYQLNSTNSSCFICNQTWIGCQECTHSTCINCTSPYKVNSTFCDPDCSIIQNCTTCRIDGRLICDTCQFGFWVSVDNLCITTCGDGIVVMGLEQCDDNNTVNKDGCSSSCRTEEYFQCNSSATGGLSNCELTRLDISGAIMTKTEDKNEVTLSLDLYPKDLVYYPTADWSQAFSSFSHLMNLVSVSFDPSTNQLRVTLAYNENLEGQSVSIFANFSQVSSQFNMSLLSLSLPQTTSNNQALYHYEDSSYTLATAVEYLSMLVAGVSLIFFALGYFGCKLQSLEAVAVVQVAALLLMTVKGMGPTYNGLKRLSYSLGVTPLFYSQNYFEESSVPSHLRTVLGSNDSFNLINVFLIVLVVPLMTALVFKVLSVTKYQGSRGVERTWKFALGSFTYYGLLFLAYGELAFLALNLRHFQLELSCGLGVLIGVFFLILLGVYVIASYRYPTWFGSFSKKFHRFQVSQYFYIFSTAERLLTAVLIISLSPGIFAAGAAVVVFTAEAIFIAGKQPYSLKEWKRPFFNKVLAVVVSLFFVGASLTTADSMINEYIPLGILLVLMAVLTVGIIGSVSQLHQYWSTREENLRIEEKAGPVMTFEQGNKKIMKQFQMKLMPDLTGIPTPWLQSLAEENTGRKLVEHDEVDLNRRKWQNYPIIGGLDLHRRIQQKRKNPQKLDSEDGEIIQIDKDSEQKIKNMQQGI